MDAGKKRVECTQSDGLPSINQQRLDNKFGSRGIIGSCLLNFVKNGKRKLRSWPSTLFYNSTKILETDLNQFEHVKKFKYVNFSFYIGVSGAVGMNMFTAHLRSLGLGLRVRTPYKTMFN